MASSVSMLRDYWWWKSKGSLRTAKHKRQLKREGKPSRLLPTAWRATENMSKLQQKNKRLSQSEQKGNVDEIINIIYMYFVIGKYMFDDRMPIRFGSSLIINFLYFNLWARNFKRSQEIKICRHETIVFFEMKRIYRRKTKWSNIFHEVPSKLESGDFKIFDVIDI